MLTKRQSDVLTFVRSFYNKSGHAPSYEEIRKGVGLASKSGVHRIVHGLAKRGYIRHLPNHNRAIEVVSDKERKKQYSPNLAVSLNVVEKFMVVEQDGVSTAMTSGEAYKFTLGCIAVMKQLNKLEEENV